MKRNAIARIVIYAVLIVLLCGILLTALGLDLFMFRTDDDASEGNNAEGTFAAGDISKLDIDWAAGSIIIQSADTNVITIRESGDFSQRYAMICNVSDDTLSVNYAKSSFVVGVGSMPEKDLVITVPMDWYCNELEIDAAAVEVTVKGVEIKDIDLDGAAMALDFDGAFQRLSCDGAGCELKLTTAYAASQIELDGAGCDLQLILPQDCGFQVQMNGLGCNYSSDISSHREDGYIVYGDRSCHVNVDGLGCHVGIYYRDPIPTITAE